MASKASACARSWCVSPNTAAEESSTVKWRYLVRCSVWLDGGGFRVVGIQEEEEGRGRSKAMQGSHQGKQGRAGQGGGTTHGVVVRRLGDGAHGVHQLHRCVCACVVHMCRIFPQQGVRRCGGESSRPQKKRSTPSPPKSPAAAKKPTHPRGNRRRPIPSAGSARWSPRTSPGSTPAP